MDILDLVVNLFTNTDAFLVSLATDYGTLIYAAMFLIFFLETGFVIMSFLPGDSLLFVAGTVAASGTASPWLIMLAVIVGAIAGNTLGYEQGRWLGNRIYSGNSSATLTTSTCATAARPSCSPASCRSSAPSRRSLQAQPA